MNQTPHRALLLGAVLVFPLLLDACSSGKAGDSALRGKFEVSLMTTGFGQIYPYRIRTLDALGNPTTTVLDISTKEELVAHVSATNGLLPVASFPTTATLPSGEPGNQFLMVRFTHRLRAESILSDLPLNQSNSGLTGNLQVLSVDPVTENTTMVRGHGFVGGKTYYDDLATPGLDLKLVQAVEKSGSSTAIRDPRATGFPRGFGSDQDLVADNTFVFVPDADDDLTTIETFPVGRLIRVIVSPSVQDSAQKSLVAEVCTATTVGPDTFPAQVIGFSQPTGPFAIAPGNGDKGVDPLTTILVSFNKPVQPRDVGAFFSQTNKTPSLGGVTLTLTIAAQPFNVINYADPVSVADFCNYVITPAYNLPSEETVQVAVNTTIRGLSGTTVGTTINTSFETGVGPGLVNAPVAPEAIYIGIGGSEPGVAVLDLNGFGQGTGRLAVSNFPKNPNVGRNGLFPGLAPGTSGLDAGGEGALTLTKDSGGVNFRLLGGSILSQVTDIHIGHPLDRVYNNENINANVTRANQTNPNVGVSQPGNTITTAPHPNPPRFVMPPPNPGQAIFCEEPTSTSSSGPVGTVQVGAPPCQGSPLNALVIGNPFGKAQNEVGLFWTNYAGVFYGPQPPPPSPQPPTPFCPYTSRQQIGHFLYVLDRGNRQVLVVNSNRFTVLETIKLSDPTSMAMSPNLKLLGVTNFSSNSVSFIDIDPASPRFHTVTTETRVGNGPTGIAWQPEGEDVLVVNQTESSMSILAGTDLRVRKTVTNLINEPIDVAVTPRQVGFGFGTGIYFAYILNGNGTVAIFESGPDGVNGIGFDNVVGVPATGTFRRARAMRADAQSHVSAVWIAHEDDSGLGQISHLELTTSLAGAIPIQPVSGGFILPPTFRQREWTITGRLGGGSPSTPIKDKLSGNAPVDIAFDDLQNFGGLADMRSIQISNLTYATHSGKGFMRPIPGAIISATYPRFVFVALGDTGKLDVFEMDTGNKLRTLNIPGISVVANYWRQ